MGVKDTDLQKAVENGVYAMYIKKLEKYGAYQVLYADGKAKSICYVALDYLEDTPPDREKICQLTPLYMESHRYHHSMSMAYIQNNRVPKAFIFCGIAALEKIYQSCITPKSELERSVSSGEVLDWLDGIRTDW